MAHAEGVDPFAMDVASDVNSTLSLDGHNCSQKPPPSRQSVEDTSESSSQTGIGQNEKNDYRIRAYPDGSTGPWVVYLQPKSAGSKPLNLIQISNDLTKHWTGVTEITKVRHNKLRVVVSSQKQANEIAVSKFFTLEYRVYIPARAVEIEGVVTEASLSTEILVNEGVGRFKNPLIPSAKILDARQLGSVSLSGDKKSFTPTASFRVTFSGSALPHYVELGKLRLPVRLFVPRVMNCQNCKQLGHTASHCSSKARCSKCGEKHEDASCSVPDPKCLYCGEQACQICSRDFP